MKVGRFQVMAILQAARANELGLSLSQAKSWGLNRAIFYAAAKRGFKERKIPGRRREEIERGPIERTRDAYYLGNEMAYVSKKGGRFYFTIGGESQTERDFKRQIENRFEDAFPEAWKESLEIVRQYPKEILLSQDAFFSEVYKPRRDDLASKWTEIAASTTKP
jgi:hypothetical protein